MSIASPFKFLDAYNKEDKDIFFGRDDEVEQLYELVFESNLTLVYGQSGTGKTSLVQCGLANRFAITDWFNVYIRRNEEINQSLVRTLKRYEPKEDRKRSNFLRERLMKKRAGVQRLEVVEQLNQHAFIRSLRAIYKHHLKPIFLIFDQFEELFILGSKGEQELFYHSIAQILESEPYCRVILIMREEAIAQLYDFEKIVPQLFDKRLRVEPMGQADTQDVIIRTCGKFEVSVESEQVPGQIIDVLSAGQGRVELTYLQVFLDQLYQEAAQSNPEKIIFTSDLVRRFGSIEDILGDFLEKQMLDLQQLTSKRFNKVSPSAVRKTLNTFVSLEGTKKPMVLEDIRVGTLTSEQLSFIVAELERSRILRFDNNLYELSHDALALQVAEARSADEVALLQIAKIVKDRYHVFDATHTLLNANELQLSRSFRQRLKEEHALTEQEWAFVRKSVRAERRRQITRAAIVISIIAVLGAFLLDSKIQARQIEAARIEQEESNYNLAIIFGNQLMAQDKYDDAKTAFNNALQIREGDKEAIRLKNEAEDKAKKSIEFDQLYKAGDELTKSTETEGLLAALGKFREAKDLGVKQSLAQKRINELEGELKGRLPTLKKEGYAFFRVKGYEYALIPYLLFSDIEEILGINPRDQEVQQNIAKCRREID